VPKFLYSIILFICFLGFLLREIIFSLNPADFYAKPLFLFTLWIETILISSVIYFIASKKRKTEFGYERTIYRKGLRKSQFIGIFVVGFVGLKVYSRLNPLTGVLFVAFMISIKKLNSGKHR